MESTEPGSIDDTLESKNLETVVEDIATKCEDSEALPSQAEDDQSGQQVYGYLYSEDATIIVDSGGFNLNGQSLIVTQNDDGNQILVLVGEDPDGQPLAQTFAHSVLQSDEVSFEDGLNEHSTLVVDEHSQGLEFMKSSEEASEEHEERHMYIENSGEILNIKNDNVGSPVDIESPLWSVSNSGHLKNDGTEMLFIPNPTVVLAPEETKHRKLMQLACIAHELQSADQKSSSAEICEVKVTEVKDPETYESSVKAAQSDEEKNSADEEADDKSFSPSEREKCVTFNPKSTKVSSALSGTSVRVVDNTVSVIHSTSSEIQGSSLKNPTKLASPPDFCSGKSFQNSESELPSEILYSNISNVSFHDNSDGSSNTKQLEECLGDSLEENSKSSVPEVTDERISTQNENLELNNNDSPLTFIDKTHIDVDNLNTTEDNVLDDTNSDLKIDEDSHTNSAILVIEDETPQSHDSDSSLSLMECHLLKEVEMNKRTSQEDNVPIETSSRLNSSDIDDDNISSTEHSISVSESESSFLSSQYSIFNYKQKAIKLSLEKTPRLSPSVQDDKLQSDNSQLELNESNMKELKTNKMKPSENIKGDSVEYEHSLSENLDSNLVIAEAVEDGETYSNAENEIKSTDNDSMVIEEDLKSQSPTDLRRNDVEELVSVDKTPVSPNPVQETQIVSPKESNDDNVVHKVVPMDLNSSPDRNAEENSDSEGPSVKKFIKKTRIRSPREEEEDYSSSEETPLMKATKKTYIIKKKMKRNIFENKISNQEKIVLYSDDINDCDNDAETSSRIHESHKESPSSQVNSTVLDDSVLESNVHAQKNYLKNSIQKEKSFYRRKRFMPAKQGLRSHSLRPRSLSSTLSHRNSEVSDSDSKKNSFDSSNSENLPWGKVLLETSFEPCSVPNDAPSTSFAPQYPKETSTPLLSPEQRIRKSNKYKRAFDRLLNSSSPVSKKQPKIGKKYFSRMHPNVIKATKSRYSSSHFSHFSKTNSLPLSIGLSKSNSPGKKILTKGQKPKEAKISFLYEEPSDNIQQPEQQSYPLKNDLYTCSSCNFVSIYVDNLMEHLKYCCNRQPVFAYEVNNMDKRQRIRGEEEITNTVNNTLKKIRSDLRSALMDDDPSVSQFGEDERDSDNVRKRKSLYRQYGYGEDDVVWVKFKDRFWPALVCSIEGLTAYVKLISYPKEVKGLKVKHENIRTFDNSKWNLLCLAEAESLPHNEIFVKAVQSCERFMSKKFLGVHVTGKEFFSVRDEVDFATDSASSDSIVNEDSDSEIEICTEPARKARYEKLDLQRIYDHLTEGKSDDYVLDIYHKRKHSKKHTTFFDPDNAVLLKHKPWFGPFEDTNQQEEVFCHFRDLFLNKIGKKGYFVSYVCQVMIPEAIVHAISVVKDIPLKDAEILFESEDSLDLENGDPSVEEILKKYS